MKLCNANCKSVRFYRLKSTAGVLTADRSHTIHTEGQAVCFFDPLRLAVYLTIWTFRFCLAENTVHLHYKKQIGKRCDGNKHCWLCRSYGTRKYTDFAKCGNFSGKCCYHCAVKSLFRSATGSCSLRDAKNSSNEAIPMFRAVQITISVLFCKSSR
jgi:hypothetical protein